MGNYIVNIRLFSNYFEIEFLLNSYKQLYHNNDK
jgi:hypothetical protein